MTRYAMTIDLVRCVGCEACMVACKLENEVPFGHFRLRAREIVAGTFPSLQGEFRIEQCYHCEDAPCVGVCPTGATFKNEDGLVVVDPYKCTGCKACVTACPYNMRYLHPNGYVDKCTFCGHRVAQGQEPACVETCPSAARIFGDLDDPEDEIVLALKTAETVDVCKPEINANPKLYYLNSHFSDPNCEYASVDVVSILNG